MDYASTPGAGFGVGSEPAAPVCTAAPAMPPIEAGEGKEWAVIPEVSDDFNSNCLDESKWEPFNKTWKGRAPGFFKRENVVVENNCLNMLCKREPVPPGQPEAYKDFTTSFMRSKHRPVYGYFEALVHPADSCTSSAFWFVHRDPKIWNEIDVFEIGINDNHCSKYHTNVHSFRREEEPDGKTISKPRVVMHPEKLCNKPFVAGVDWTEDSITWYLNGRPVRMEPNTYHHHPMWLQFDCETMPRWFGLPEEGDPRMPATFKVHYVRGWQRVDKC